MARDRHEKERSERLAPFVPLLKDTMDEPAWRAMSHGAKWLYVALKRRVSKGALNNGKVFLSQRQAATELNSHHNEIARWFRELQHYGFIVQMAAGSLGTEGKGTAPHWRLTELGYMKEPPTQEYRRWNGTRFRDAGKIKSRAGKPRGGVREMAHTTVPENQHTSSPNRAGNGAHRAEGDRAGNPAHTKVTTTIAEEAASPRLVVAGGR